jgi:uncharacterized protein
VRHTHMTVTIVRRRVALVSLVLTWLVVVYLAGAACSAGTSAAAFTGAVNTSSTQPLTIGGVGAAGITVGGRADVAGTPDTLRLDLSGVATAPSVPEALAKANGSAVAVQESLLSNGVAKKDLQTSGLNIAPSYDDTTSGTPRLKGYDVTESVSAKLRDLRRAGEAIGKAVAAGGNAIRVNGISLDLEDDGVLVSKAREAAFADAKTKAEQYARAAGRSLGEAVSIAENVATPSPLSLPSASVAKQADVPLQPGSQEVSVTVTVVFAMR